MQSDWLGELAEFSRQARPALDQLDRLASQMATILSIDLSMLHATYTTQQKLTGSVGRSVMELVSMTRLH